MHVRAHCAGRRGGLARLCGLGRRIFRLRLGRLGGDLGGLFLGAARIFGAAALFLGEARSLLALQLQAVGGGLRLLDLLDLAVVFVLARLLQRLLALRALMRGQA
jgi:hypothetical protein